MLQIPSHLEKQKEVLFHYNSNTNRKYIHIDNEFHYYLFKICDLEAFWKIILEDYRQFLSTSSSRNNNHPL